MRVVDDVKDGLQGGFGKDEQSSGFDSQPCGPQFQLLRALFTGDVEDLFLLRHEGKRLEQERGFPDAGVACQQNEGPADQPSSQHSVPFTDACGEPCFRLHRNFREGQGTSRLPTGLRPP